MLCRKKIEDHMAFLLNMHPLTPNPYLRRSRPPELQDLKHQKMHRITPGSVSRVRERFPKDGTLG